jgi:hypothetical protein
MSLTRNPLAPARPGADQRLVVGQDDPDRHRAGAGTGSVAATRKPPPGRGPAEKSPPSSAARDRPVRAGAQQRGAGGVFELADLAGEDGVPDAELAGCVAEAGLAGEGEEPADALLGARVGEHVPDVRGERAGSAEGGEWVSAAGDAVPDADAALAGRGGEVLDCGGGLSGDVLEAALAVLVLLAEPVRVDAAVRGRGRAAEPGAGEGCLMARSLHPVMRAILRGP